MGYQSCSLKNGFRGVIAIHEQTKDRLLNTCFRGVDKKLAGNFCAFGSIQEFLGDPKCSRVVKAVLEEMEILVKDPSNFGDDHSFEIEWGTPVGWSSTDNLIPAYHDGVLERKHFGWQGRANALFVQSQHFSAPITSTITIAFTFDRNLSGVPCAIIRTIYPGKDIGDLVGDITKREKVVFFDWNHPGAEMPKQVRAAQAASA